MLFRLDKFRIDAEVRNTERFASKHTGVDLRRLTIDFSVEGTELNDMILGVKRTELLSQDSEGNWTVKWSVGNTSYRTMGRRGDVFDHSWDLEQKEELSVQSLVVGDLVFHPVFYRERFLKDCLVINAYIDLPQDEAKRLRKIMADMKDFEVIRNGVNATPRKMRFGRGLWSLKDGMVRREINLVDCEYDELNKGRYGEDPISANTTLMTLQTSTKLKALLQLLQEKGLLTDDDLTALEESAKELQLEEAAAFEKVSNIEDWLGE